MAPATVNAVEDDALLAIRGVRKLSQPAACWSRGTAQDRHLFRVGETWLIDAVGVADGATYADAVEHGGHYDYWEALQPRLPAELEFRAHDYDYYPRGRVVYFPAEGRFRTYVDNCITRRQRADLLLQFGLSDAKVEFEGTEDATHYVCANCSPNYLE